MLRQYFYKENIFNYAVLIDLSIPVSYLKKKQQNTLSQIIGKSFHLLTGIF